MVFSSHIFLFYFLPAALLLYYASPRALKNVTLTLVSYVFYGWTNPWFLLLILWSTLVDYSCGNLIAGQWRLFRPGVQRRVFLTLSLISNIGMLLFFKYFMFAQENLNRIRELFGAESLPIITVLLPAGISFYTFESISYNVDIYLGHARPALDWVMESAGNRPILSAPPSRTAQWLRRLGQELRAFAAFACYITQFPHLVAGPIIRYQDMERQLHQRTHTLEKFGRGVFFLSLGMAKKLLLADPAGEVADAAFAGGPLHTADAWYGVFGYAFQIYFDFSGYSDMAVGLALMLGFEFARNFDKPYQAPSITEFWRRWHISLSTWLRDYIYIPLGGNRRGELRTYANLMAVMLIGGFWHGASWNFMIWGGIHGLWLALERMLGKESFYARAPLAVRVGLTFVIVNIAWVFFRAPDLPAAVEYLTKMFGLQGDLPASALLVRAELYSPGLLLWLALAAIIAFFGTDTWELARRITPLRAAVAMLLLFAAVAAMSSRSFIPFLYFQF